MAENDPGPISRTVHMTQKWNRNQIKTGHSVLRKCRRKTRLMRRQGFYIGRVMPLVRAETHLLGGQKDDSRPDHFGSGVSSFPHDPHTKSQTTIDRHHNGW